MKELYHKIRDFIYRYKLQALREVALFMLITIIIHFSYRYWANQLHYAPIYKQVYAFEEKLTQLVYDQSKFVVTTVFDLRIRSIDDSERIIYFENNGFVGVGHSCSGFKQLLQVLFLFLIYPGLWKKKLWFIPMGIIIIYIVNIMRIVILAVVVNSKPEYFRFIHDNVVRPFFYVVIFALWVIWVEKYYPKRMKSVKKDPISA